MYPDVDEAAAFIRFMRIHARNQLGHAPNWAAVKAVAAGLLQKRMLRAREARLPSRFGASELTAPLT